MRRNDSFALRPVNLADYREALQRAEEERAATRQRALDAQASDENDPQQRIATWEQLHGLPLPVSAEHALVLLIARQTRLSVAQVHDEQRRRASLVPPA
jgi:hypothetical protein